MKRPTPANLFNHQPATREGEIGLRAAIRAGQVLERKFYEAREIREKGYRDIVTDADLAANQIVRRAIERAFPSHSILSEEDPAPTNVSEYLWMIDPLDGTTNYSRRIPIFAVSLALTRRGRPIVGIVFDPLRRECFFAERGHGAYLNGVRVHASHRTQLSEAVVGYELARDPVVRAQGFKLFVHFARQAITARIGGSAALSLCYIGAGRLDTYLQLTLYPWDVAAGILIAREGGAKVTHLDGSPATLAGGAYLAAAPKLFPEYFKQVRQWNEDAR